METMTRTTAPIRIVNGYRSSPKRLASRLSNGRMPSHRWLLAGVALSSLLLGGCVSDQQLLREDLPSALAFVREHAARDLGCPDVEADVTDDREEAGQPLGDLLSEYRVTARGCGKMRAYDVVCDGKLCSLKE